MGEGLLKHQGLGRHRPDVCASDPWQGPIMGTRLQGQRGQPPLWGHPEGGMLPRAMAAHLARGALGGPPSLEQQVCVCPVDSPWALAVGSSQGHTGGFRNPGRLGPSFLICNMGPPDSCIGLASHVGLPGHMVSQ